MDYSTRHAELEYSMSQRPPKKNRSNRNTSRRARTQSPTQPQSQNQAAPQSARTKASQAASGQADTAPRSTERRQARRDEAIRKEKQQKQLRLIIGGVVAAVIVAAVLIFLNRPTNDAANIDYEGIAFAQPPITQTAGTPAADASGPPVGAILGDPNAPVTFTVYADFQCPFCAQFQQDTYPQIVDDFVRDGKVKIEFREFPALGGSDLTDDGNESAQSAEAAMCAAEQGKYLEYHDKLYANHRGENQGAFSNDRLRTFADDIGLDTGAFNECLDSGRYEQYLIQSMDEGRALGITATPMFVIDNGNGAPNVVQQTSAGYDLLKRQIQTAIDTAP
jgi:protein-disulfide isomerase